MANFFLPSFFLDVNVALRFTIASGDNMYKIKDLATLANISTRTLRHYDKIGLLSPSHRNRNGYRYYNKDTVDTLQQILFFKELGYSLDKIHLVLNGKSFNQLESLYDHLTLLTTRKDHIENVMDLVLKTIQSIESGEEMSDKEKFEAFKKEQIQQNTETYGGEMNQKYDPDSIQQSNERLMSKSPYEMRAQDELTMKLNQTIIDARNTNNPASDKAQEMCQLHKDWICFYWPHYNKEHHLSVVEMYTLDERFTKYYNEVKIGAAQFLFEAMKRYIGK